MRRVDPLSRLAGAAAAVALALALAVGCAPRSKPPLELVFATPWPDSALTSAVGRFEAENPGVRVRVDRLPAEAHADSLRAWFAAGPAPDLCAVGTGVMPGLLAAGVLSDWSAGVADQRDSLVGWEPCTVGDAVYGMPCQLAPFALYWDKALFARARLDTTRAPATWEETRRAALAVQRLGRGVHGYGVCANDRGRLIERFLPYAWGDSGEVLSAGLDSSRFDSPANRAALEFYVSLRRGGTIATAAALDREFLEGRLGMLVTGPWMLTALRAAGGARRIGVARVPAPAAGRGHAASLALGEVLVSFQSSRHKAEALRLARFLVRPDIATRLSIGLADRVPSNRGADSLAWFRGHPAPCTLVTQLETARWLPRHPRWDEMAAAVEDELEQALFERKTVARAAADADARIAELAGGR